MFGSVRGVGIVAVAFTLACSLACSSGSVFTCAEASQCSNDGVPGYCEPTGHCSFDDDDCPSNRRYGEHAANGLVGLCVPVSDETSTSSGSSGSSTSTTSGATGVTSVSTDLETTDTSGSETASGTQRCEAVRIHGRVPAGAIVAEIFDFPLLLQIDDPALGAMADGAANVAFASPDGAALPFEVEVADAQAGQLLAWVRVPALGPVEDTEFDVWIGHPDLPPGPSPTDVWDSDYLAVWHFSVVEGGILDATQTQPNGLISGGVTPAPGVIGIAAEFDGATGLITVDQTFKSELNSFTASMWVQARGLGEGGSAPVFRRLSGASLFPRVFVNGQGLLGGQLQTSKMTQGLFVDELVEDTQQHVVFSYDDAASIMSIHIDGQLVGSSETLPPPLRGGENSMEIGNDADLRGVLDGQIDELRVSSTRRSDEWIRVSHLNQSNPAAFVLLDAVEPGVCP